MNHGYFILSLIALILLGLAMWIITLTGWKNLQDRLFYNILFCVFVTAPLYYLSLSIDTPTLFADLLGVLMLMTALSAGGLTVPAVFSIIFANFFVFAILVIVTLFCFVVFGILRRRQNKRVARVYLCCGILLSVPLVINLFRNYLIS